MRRCLFFLFGLGLSLPLLAQKSWSVPTLYDSVEILIDRWGVPHIYAQNEEDLFFAQGWQAARDRLFQFEIWRRQATGTLAEVLGPRALERDIGARLFRYRGDLEQELNHYHPRGARIVRAFVAGINAWIAHVRAHPELLPPEFRMLGIEPGFWTPEVVVSRHQGLLGNSTEELEVARLVATVGEEKARALLWFHPHQPDLTIDPAIPKELLFEDLLRRYNAFRRPLTFVPEDVRTGSRADREYWQGWVEATRAEAARQRDDARLVPGSNNWVVSGRLTDSGCPMMANDPHRRLSAPSLRYIAHLSAPGWHVIGGGEPVLPGISIGHNEHGAWGLTVFRTDAEDLYIYDTNPDNADQYWYQGRWEDMTIELDTFEVKGQAPVVVRLRYTRHGPVTWEDSTRHKACALRCGWLEPGGAPYLASLRMDQAANWDEFRRACNYSHIPGENMVWADREGHIGWQAVGIAPIRRHWSGLVPVPGDGRYEWDGYLPIYEKPHRYDPPEGFIATANANLTPPDFPHLDAIGYLWSDPYRQHRAEELLASSRRHSLVDMAAWQTDYLSIPARQLVPLLQRLSANDARLERARRLLLQWDYRLTPESVAAAIYSEWEWQLRQQMKALVVPSAARPWADIQLKRVIDWLLLPDAKFGESPIAGRDAFLMDCLTRALDELSQRLGPDMDRWQYGQPRNKHVHMPHILGAVADATTRRQLEPGPLPRGGNSFTLNNTGSGLRQSHGATFRIIVDTGDWDRCLASNAPGQSGDPASKHYRDLFELWASDGFFPLFFSREKVESVTEERIVLLPAR